MSWGTGLYGLSPWGGGDPSIAGNITVNSVRFIGNTYIRLNLNTQVIVNAAYLSTANYSISVLPSTPIAGDAVRVVRVIAPAREALKVDYIYLETTPHTNGAYYQVNFTTLNTLDGAAGVGSSSTSYASRVTKTMSTLKSLPSHFHKGLDALLHATIAAISIQDDDIGGSRSDEFP